MTPPTAPERCPTCDRDYCNRWLWSRRCAQAPTQAHFDECAAHRVDWRARAIAAERDSVELARVTAAIGGVHASDLPAFARTVADHAAQWAKVAPLIERLREAMAAWDATDSVSMGRALLGTYDAAAKLLAATEVTP